MRYSKLLLFFLMVNSFNVVAMDYKKQKEQIHMCGICHCDGMDMVNWPSGVSDHVHWDCYKLIFSIEWDECEQFRLEWKMPINQQMKKTLRSGAQEAAYPLTLKKVYEQQSDAGIRLCYRGLGRIRLLALRARSKY